MSAADAPTLPVVMLADAWETGEDGDFVTCTQPFVIDDGRDLWLVDTHFVETGGDPEVWVGDEVSFEAPAKPREVEAPAWSTDDRTNTGYRGATVRVLGATEDEPVILLRHWDGP